MKRLILFIAAGLVSGFTMQAQKQVTINHDYQGFTGIEATDGFEIAITGSDIHSVKMTAAASIEEYIQAYVKDGILYLNIDEKSMPSELKKTFKAKNSAISTVRAEVSMSTLKSLSVNGNSVVESADTLSMDKLGVKLSRTASVRKFAAKASSSAVIDLSGKAQAYMAIETPALEVDATNNTSAEMIANTGRLTVYANSYAKVEVFGKADSVYLFSEGNAKLEFNTKK